MSCLVCVRDFHEECEFDPCCCNTVTTAPVGQTYKKDRNLLIDAKSTGRKEAAKLYPLDRTAYCEWMGLKFAGGGLHPVIGCGGNLQTHIHHGPIKDTLVNEPGNVHRVCAVCHNRYHTLNDPDYDPIKAAEIPHDKFTKATSEEIMKNEVYWRGKKAKDPTYGKHTID